MARKNQVTLHQGVGNNSGKPYTALKINVGKWEGLHFPTRFEKEYVEDYLNDGQPMSVSVDPKSDNKIIISGGDYVSKMTIDSILEYKYVVKHLTTIPEEELEDDDHESDDDGKIDLENEDEPRKKGLFS